MRSTAAATHPPRMQAEGQMEHAQSVPEYDAQATTLRDAAGPAAGGAVQTEEWLVECQENIHQEAVGAAVHPHDTWAASAATALLWVASWSRTSLDRAAGIAEQP